MAPIVVQAYEIPILATLITTYDLNAPGEGMTPDADMAFRRNPAPAIMEGQLLEREKKSRLAWAWESLLFQLSEAHLYDGTPSSALKFERTTGLTPARFAQGCMEAHGFLWKFYHPCRSGQEVARALCDFWAAKVKHWRTVSAEEIRANSVSKIGEQEYAKVGGMIDGALPRIMSINGKRYEECMLLRALKSKGSFDCAAHPMASFCNCATAFNIPVIYDINTKRNFLTAWNATLLHNDEAFLFRGAADVQSSTLFKVRTGGQTPAVFASRFIDSQPPFWEPAASTKHELVSAMLAYWHRLARDWRASCKTRQEVRTKSLVDMKAEGGMRKIDLETGVGETADPHENDVEDPLCRYVGVDDVPPRAGHRHTVVLYAKTGGEGGGLGYEVLGFVPCHENCAPPSQRLEVEVGAITAEFAEEDMEKARAVRAEW
ncbi:hypothetical protein LTR65_009859 [Meristemomyces frigidus]